MSGQEVGQRVVALTHVRMSGQEDFQRAPMHICVRWCLDMLTSIEHLCAGACTGVRIG
jgi:hypothetical protein